MLLAGTFYIKAVIGTAWNSLYLVDWLIFSAAVFMNLYYNTYITSLKAVGAIVQAQKSTVLSKIVQLVVSVAGLWCGGGFTALIVAYFVSGVVLRVSSKYLLLRFKNVKTLINQYKGTDKFNDLWETIKTISHNAVRAGVSTIATTLMTQANTLISSYYLGLEVTAVYGLTMQIVMIIMGVAQVIFQTKIPKITSYRIANNTKGLQREFSVGVFSYIIIFVLGLAAFATVGTPLVEMIKSNTKLILWLTLWLGANIFFENIYALSAGYISTANELPFVKSVVITSVFRVIAALIFVVGFNLGIVGLLLSQMLPNWVYINWRWPVYALKDLGLSYKELLKLGFETSIMYIKQILCKITKKGIPND